MRPVRFVTGAIDAGKTTCLRTMWAGEGGEGLALEKCFWRGQMVGQRMVSLCSGQGVLFSVKKPFCPREFQAADEIGEFCVSGEGLAFFESELESFTASKIFFDELGPLELMGRGFAPALRRFLNRSDAALTIAVRESCLDNIQTAFGFEAQEIIWV